MDAKAFFGKVAAMRNAQKEYFKSRSRTALERSKALEKEVDAEIARVRSITGEKERTAERQQRLEFGGKGQ